MIFHHGEIPFWLENDEQKAGTSWNCHELFSP
jgi:hypothetical protein